MIRNWNWKRFSYKNKDFPCFISSCIVLFCCNTLRRLVCGKKQNHHDCILWRTGILSIFFTEKMKNFVDSIFGCIFFQSIKNNLKCCHTKCQLYEWDRWMIEWWFSEIETLEQQSFWNIFQIHHHHHLYSGWLNTTGIWNKW